MEPTLQSDRVKWEMRKRLANAQAALCYVPRMELMATEQREQIGRIQKLVAYSRPGTGTGNLHVLVGREPGFDHCSDSQLLSVVAQSDCHSDTTGDVSA